MILLNGCAGVGFEAPPSTCPPVVEYSRAEQAQAAEELKRLPEGALIVSWLADYAVLRAQVRSCAPPSGEPKTQRGNLVPSRRPPNAWLIVFFPKRYDMLKL